MRKVAFHKQAFDDYTNWEEVNKHIFERIVLLIKEIQKEPFTGIGKPEPLKFDKQGYWSRRINSEHRLVYRVTKETITIISCRYHY
jgi:toxin YoeB